MVGLYRVAQCGNTLLWQPSRLLTLLCLNEATYASGPGPVPVVFVDLDYLQPVGCLRLKTLSS